MGKNIIIMVFVCVLAFTQMTGFVKLFLQNDLVVEALDVGQGDAILVSRGSQQMLIDGGPGSVLSGVLSSHMPMFDSSIEMMVLSHPHADHISGLFDVFDSYSVGVLVVPKIDAEVKNVKALEALARERGTEVREVLMGDVLKLDDLQFDVLWPKEHADAKDLNAISVVLRLRDVDGDGDDEVMFMGDATGDVEKEIVARGVLDTVEVLKVGHHGSASSSTEGFLEMLKPRLSVVSVGAENSYGHPAGQTVKVLAKHDCSTLRTDQGGSVVLVWKDGAPSVVARGEYFSLWQTMSVLLNNEPKPCTIGTNF
jgi:beta-lactamase superfamily II metal-dependent hydrolase